jgi:hypothetical protein
MRPETKRHKIVFLLPHPQTLDFRRKFFVPQFLKEGFDAEYWDVGAILGYDMEFTRDLHVDGLEYVEIPSLKELAARLRREERASTVYVLQITRAFDSFFIYFLLSRFKKQTVTLARGYLPSVPRSERTLQHYLRGLRSVDQIKRWMSRALYSLLNKLLPIRKYDVAFVAGRVAKQVNAGDAIKLVRIHHADVDAAYRDERISVELPERYCVFVDDYLPFHPDFGGAGEDTVNAAAYYSALNDFFRLVEVRFGAAVIIAAHPKAIYASNPFEGRMILWNETNALVKKAEVVFAHASTAVSFAVIHKKELCLIFNEEIKRTHPTLYAQMLETVEILGCPIINFETSRNIDDLAVARVDEKRYERYYADYLSNDVHNMDSFRVIAHELCRLSDERFRLE